MGRGCTDSNALVTLGEGTQRYYWDLLKHMAKWKKVSFWAFKPRISGATDNLAYD